MKTVACICILCLSGLAAGEELTLRSGGTIEGDLVSATKSNVQIVVNGETLVYPTVSVASIAFDEEPREEDRGMVSAEIPSGSEITLQVVAVRRIADHEARIMFRCLHSVRLVSGGELEVGTILEANLRLMPNRDWAEKLRFHRALTATGVYALTHEPIDGVSGQAERSVLYGPSEETLLDLPAGLPAELRGSTVVRVRFAEKTGDREP